MTIHRPPSITVDHAGRRSHAVLTASDGSEVLLPLGSRRAAATALIRHTTAVSLPELLARRAVSIGLLLGGTGLIRKRTSLGFPSDNLADRLAEVLNETEVHLAVASGPPRPNQKPVIRIMRRNGQTIAFAKVGWTDHAAKLLATEIDFLGAAPKFERLELPTVLHQGLWNGWPIAVFSAVMGRAGKVTPDADHYIALARSQGTSIQPVGSSTYLADLQEQVALMPAPVRPLAERLIEHQMASKVPIEFGRSHGDWTPWNIGRLGASRLAVWDWERTRPSVPVGFDVIHYLVQPGLAANQSMPELVSFALTKGRPLLRHLGVGEEAERSVIDLYLLDQLVRHSAGEGGRANELVSNIAEAFEIL